MFHLSLALRRGSSISLAAALLTIAPGLSMAEDGVFPVQVAGLFGSIEIASQPERVLALSGTDADHLLSLGVTPMAVPSMPQTDAMTNGTGILPW